MTNFQIGLIVGAVVAVIFIALEIMKGHKRTHDQETDTFARLKEEEKELRKEEAKKLEAIRNSDIETLTQEEIAEATPLQFDYLDISKAKKESERIFKEKKKNLMTEWLNYVYRRIKEEVDAGENAAIINCDLNYAEDMYFHKCYDRDLMIVATTKLLEEKGFIVQIFEGKPYWCKLRPYFTMIVSWTEEEKCQE